MNIVTKLLHFFIGYQPSTKITITLIAKYISGTYCRVVIKIQFCYCIRKAVQTDLLNKQFCKIWWVCPLFWRNKGTQWPLRWDQLTHTRKVSQRKLLSEKLLIVGAKETIWLYSRKSWPMPLLIFTGKKFDLSWRNHWPLKRKLSIILERNVNLYRDLIDLRMDNQWPFTQGLVNLYIKTTWTK